MISVEPRAGGAARRGRLLRLDDARVLARRVSTSRANTTAAAGAPPITDARAPSTATTSMSSRSVFENTTNAPPW